MEKKFNPEPHYWVIINELTGIPLMSTCAWTRKECQEKYSKRFEEYKKAKKAGTVRAQKIIIVELD